MKPLKKKEENYYHNQSEWTTRFGYVVKQLDSQNNTIMCPVVKEYRKEITDYEAFDAMHNADGIVDKSTSPSRL